MRMYRERVVAPAVVVIEAAVCFEEGAGWFMVRCRARARNADGVWEARTLSYPLSRRQVEAESGGPELADFLTEHPGYWWRLPVAQQVEEGYGL